MVVSLHLSMPGKILKTLAVCFLMAFCLLATNSIKAQVIVEIFDKGGAWGSGSFGGGTGSRIPTYPSSSTNQAITMSKVGGGTVASTTNAATNSNSIWTWVFSGLTTSTYLNGTYTQGHSRDAAVSLTNNAGYLLTPIIQNGISTITFWLGSDNSGSPSEVFVGLRTNVAGTNSTVYPTSATNNRYNTATAGGVYTLFSLNRSAGYNTATPPFSVANGATPRQYTYTIPTSLASLPMQVAFFNDGDDNGGFYASAIIDDIVITSPAASSVPGTATATASSVCNGSTTTINLTGYSGTIQWQQSVDNSTWVPVVGGSGGTTATYTTATLNSGLYYRAVVTNSPAAAANSNSVLVATSTSTAGYGYSTGTLSTGLNDNINGFNAWTVSSSGGGTNTAFLASSNGSGSGTSVNIDVNSKAFGLYSSGSGATSNAIRPFTSALAVGNTISFTEQNGWIDAGAAGFSLYNASGNALMEYYISPSTNYTVRDGAGAVVSSIPWSANGFNITIAYTSASGNGSYKMSVTPVGSTTTTYFTGNFLASVSGGQVPNQIRFFNSNAANGGSNTAYNFWFNSLTLGKPLVTTQPSTGTQTVCTGTALTPLTVAASGTNLTYQWYYNSSNSNTGGTAVSTGTGYTTASFTPANATPSAYYYYCVVSGGCSGTSTSNTTGLITVSSGTLPVLYAPPGSPTVRYDFSSSNPTLNGGSNGGVAVPDGNLPNGVMQTTDRFGNANSAYAINQACSGCTVHSSAGVGTNQWIHSTSNMGITYNPMAIGIWFQTTTGTGGTLIAENNDNAGLAGSPDYNLYMDNAGHIVFDIYSGSTHVAVTSPNTYKDGVWHHTAVTISSGSPATITLYMDGASVASTSSSITGATTGYFLIGYNNQQYTLSNTPTNWGFTGNVDDAVFYSNTSFSATQVAQLYGVPQLSGPTTCTGTGSVDTLKSYTLATGTYNVTYNVSGTNTVSGTASMSFTAGSPGTGTFTTGSLPNAGAANVVNVTAIANTTGCIGSASLAIKSPAFSTISTPATPGSITGAATRCAAATGLTYSIAAVTNATSYTWTVPAGWAITAGQGTTSLTVTAGAGGTSGNITVTATGICGTSSAQTLAVSVTAASVGGTASTVTPSICTGGAATINLTGSTGTIQWQTNASGSFVNIPGASSASYNTPALTTSTSYQAVVTNGICSSSNSTTQAIAVSPVSVGGTTSTLTPSICTGSTATVTLTGNTGTIQWQTNASGSFVNIPGATSASYNTPALTTSTSYQAVVTSGTCSSSTSTIQAITVSGTSVGGSATATPGILCNGGVAVLTLTGNTGTSIQWQQSTDNSTWSNVTGGSGATTATYTTPALYAGKYYKALVSNGACVAASSISDTVTVRTSSTASGTVWTTASYNDNTTGLGPWVFTASSGAAGFFTGSTTADATYTSPSIDQSSNSWGIFSNSGSLGDAKRTLTSFGTGNTITFSIQNGNIDAPNAVGFSLYNSSNQPLIEFFFKGGNSSYTVSDAAGQNATGISFRTSGLTATIGYTAANTYAISITAAGSNTVLYSGTGTFIANGNQTPTQVRFFNGNAGSGSTKNVYFNSLSLNNPLIYVQPATAPPTICVGNTGSLSIAAAGTNLTYQWYSNSTASNTGGTPVSGATASSYAPPAPAPGVSVFYYCVVSGNCSTSVTSNVSGAIALAGSNMWTGISNDWNSAGNWSCGTVPTSTTDVEIPTSPSGTNMPTLSAASTAHNILLNNSARLSLGGQTLTVTGTISGNGKIKGSATSSLVLNKVGNSGTLAFAGVPDSLLNFTLAAKDTATLAASITRLYIAPGTNATPGTLNIGDSAVLNTNDSLTVASNNSSTAMVTAIPELSSGPSTGAATGKISGKVTVQRYVHSNVNVPGPAQNGTGNTSVNNGLRAWRMMTAPLTTSGSPTIQAAWQNSGIAYDVNNPATKGIGTLVTGAAATNGLDAVSGVSLYSWSTNSNSFATVSNTTTAISKGNYGGANAGNTGYMLFVRGDRNPTSVRNPELGGITINNTMLNPTGNLITGRQVYTIQKSASGAIKFTMVGNPYAAPISLATLINSNPDKKYYIWNPNLSVVGGFVSIDYIIGSVTYSPSSLTNRGVTEYVQSGQAFLVEGAIAGSDGTVQIDESNKANANNNYVFRPASAIESFESNLYFLNADGSIDIADGNTAQYRDDFSANVDSKDVRKLTNLNENFALLRNSKTLSVERRPIIGNNDTLFFKLTQTTTRNYQLQFTATALDHPNLQGFFKDSYTGDSTMLNLTGNTTVNVTIDTAIAASKASDRFMIVFAVSKALPVTFTGIKAVQKNQGNIAVSWDVQNEININSYVVEKSTDDKKYSSIGTLKADGKEHYNLLDENAVNGSNYYRIRSVGNNGAIQYSHVAIVNLGNASPAIAVYPNPVKDGQINLQFTNMPAGTYTVNLRTTLGQIISSKIINHLGGSITETVPFNKDLARGVYNLEINKPNNTKTSIILAY